MSSSMRTSTALSAPRPATKRKTINPLKLYFVPYQLRGKGTLNTIDTFVYKPQGRNLSDCPKINLLIKPETAMQFYSVAMAIHHDKLDEAVSYIHAWTSFEMGSEIAENFVVDLLIDAANGGYARAKRALAKMLINAEYLSSTTAIKAYFKSQKYQCFRNRSNLDELEFWTQKKIPTSIAEFEELANDLEREGAIGSYYFLTFQEQTENLKEKVRQIAVDMRIQGAKKANLLIKDIYRKVDEGLVDEVQELCNLVTKITLEVYTDTTQIEKLRPAIVDWLNQARENANAKEEKTTEIANKPSIPNAPEPLKRSSSYSNYSNHSTQFKPIALSRSLSEGTPSPEPSPTAFLETTPSPSGNQQDEMPTCMSVFSIA